MRDQQQIVYICAPPRRSDESAGTPFGKKNREENIVDIGGSGVTLWRDPRRVGGVPEARGRPLRVRCRPRCRDIFRRVVAAITIGAFGGTVFAQPVHQLPLPVSDQGVTSYGTYSRLAVGTQSARVNVLSGNLVIDAVDLTIGGRSLPLVLQRFYNSQNTRVGFFGHGWSSFSTSA